MLVKSEKLNLKKTLLIASHQKRKQEESSKNILISIISEVSWCPYLKAVHSQDDRRSGAGNVPEYSSERNNWLYCQLLLHAIPVTGSYYWLPRNQEAERGTPHRCVFFDGADQWVTLHVCNAPSIIVYKVAPKTIYQQKLCTRGWGYSHNPIVKLSK